MKRHALFYTMAVTPGRPAFFALSLLGSGADEPANTYGLDVKRVRAFLAKIIQD